MQTILVWILVTSSYHVPVTYSPPIATLEDCQRMQKNIDKDIMTKVCVQVNMVVNVNK